MKKEPSILYLCAKCADTYAASFFRTEEVNPLVGVPYKPEKRKCEQCGKMVYGSYIRILRRGE